jgi:uncharacterized OB-fold protein
MHYTSLQPIPVPDSESAPFWEGAKNDKLMVQHCIACGQNRLPATTYCPQCNSADTEWIESKGLGTIFSWIVVRHPVPAQAYQDEVPYVVALVSLDEGPRIVANIVECPTDGITPDMRLQVLFLSAAEGFKLPAFKPANP